MELQKKLEELQGYKGVGNKLTQADTNKRIAATTAQIRQLSDAVDTADAKIRELRQSIKDVQAGNIPTVQAPKTSTNQQDDLLQYPPGGGTDQASGNCNPGCGQCGGAGQDQPGRGLQECGHFWEASQKSNFLRLRRLRLPGQVHQGDGGQLRPVWGPVLAYKFHWGFLPANGPENQEVNQTLSEIKSSLQYVSDALAAVIYPIVKAIAPILVTILGRCGRNP